MNPALKFCLPALSLLLLLAGCTTLPRVESDVSRFHKLPPQGSGQTFAIQPAVRAPELEFSTYAARVDAHLREYGWRPAPANRAEYLVKLGYRRGASRQVLDSMPVYGQTGGGTAYTVGTVSTHSRHHGSSQGTYVGATYVTPTLGIVGAQPYSYTVYDRHLSVEIRDRAGRPVFEGRAVSTGPGPEIAAALPAMIDALFTHFPGESGKTVRIRGRSER